ncbi:hypothetical protein GA707_18035 [Nostocoides sp. F2B08]|uniref:hypothetical protein n=1 Tax=Nostocoides sp. F2B08 TaxID=2653936 RepID=UPI001263BD47|nr:hypothetical protein [Tetrasphaera sp. F2B08]KAB7741444.1 hypothetical protein GA707_18035 [Tetrasphaera sp. F2B08]
MSPSLQRALGAVGLVTAGILSLPVVASVLDGPGAENWIIPVDLLLMAGIGAGAGVALPALTTPGAPTGRRALIGAAWGVLAALIGLLVFWLLLSGFGGA